jgi:hypothetical protein
MKQEFGGEILLRNVDWLSTDSMALYPRRYTALYDQRCDNPKSYLGNFLLPISTNKFSFLLLGKCLKKENVPRAIQNPKT